MIDYVCEWMLEFFGIGSVSLFYCKFRRFGEGECWFWMGWCGSDFIVLRGILKVEEFVWIKYSVGFMRFILIFIFNLVVLVL